MFENVYIGSVAKKEESKQNDDRRVEYLLKPDLLPLILKSH